MVVIKSIQAITDELPQSKDLRGMVKSINLGHNDALGMVCGVPLQVLRPEKISRWD